MEYGAGTAGNHSGEEHRYQGSSEAWFLGRKHSRSNNLLFSKAHAHVRLNALSAGLSPGSKKRLEAQASTSVICDPFLGSQKKHVDSNSKRCCIWKKSFHAEHVSLQDLYFSYAQDGETHWHFLVLSNSHNTSYSTCMVPTCVFLACAMIQPKLVDKLFDGPIDIIGDIHGESWQKLSPVHCGI